MKKLFKSLIIILVVLVVVPLALFYIFISDSSKMNVTYDEAFNKEVWSESLVVDSLDHARDQKVAKFAVSESDLNNFIHSVIKDNNQLKKHLTQLAIDIGEDNLEITVSGKAAIFETRARAKVTIARETVFSEDIGKEALVLTLGKISLGRLSKIKEVIMFFVTRLISNQTVDSLTEQLKIHFDLNNSKAFIYIDDLTNFVNENARDDAMSNFYYSFINDFIKKNLIVFNFYGDDEISVGINLQRLTGNNYGEGAYIYYPMKYNDTMTYLNIGGTSKKLSLDTINEAIVSLMNDGLLNEANRYDVSNYLYYGYRTKGTGNNAPTFSLNSIGITDKTAYKGFNLVSNISLDGMICDSITSFHEYNLSSNAFDIAQISESDINNCIKSQNILGNKYFLSRKNSDNKYKQSYIALDNAYLNFTETEAFLSLGLNFNGLETNVTFTMTKDVSSSDKSKISYNIISVYFGNSSEDITASQDTREFLFGILHDAVNDGALSFSETGTMTISLDAFIDDAINSITSDPFYRNFLKNEADFELAIIGDNIADNSTLKIVAKRH